MNINHNRLSGVAFVLNGDTDNWKNNRKDTKMLIEGNVNVLNSFAHPFIIFGDGHFTFNQNAHFTSPHEGGQIGAEDNTEGTLEFKGETIVENGLGTFITMGKNSAPTITFNKLTFNSNVNPSDQREVFRLMGGKTSILGDSTITAPNINGVSLYHRAIFENGGNLKMTTKDGIYIKTAISKAVPVANGPTNPNDINHPDNPNNPKNIPYVGAQFNNLATGIISNDKEIVLHTQNGDLVINNEGQLTSTGDAIFKNSANGAILATNTGILTGAIISGDSDTINLKNTGTWNLPKILA